MVNENDDTLFSDSIYVESAHNRQGALYCPV